MAINCCNINKKTKKCFRKSDKKVFNLPRRFSKTACLTKKIKGSHMIINYYPGKTRIIDKTIHLTS